MKRLLLILAVALYALVPVIAIAQVVPQPPGQDVDVGATFNTVIGAVQGGQVALAFGAILMLVVWALRTFIWKNLNTKWLPYVAVVIGVLSACAVALVADPKAWLTAILLGVNAGVSAAGTWGLLGIVRKKDA